MVLKRISTVLLILFFLSACILGYLFFQEENEFSFLKTEILIWSLYGFFIAIAMTVYQFECLKNRNLHFFGGVVLLLLFLLALINAEAFKILASWFFVLSLVYLFFATYVFIKNRYNTHIVKGIVIVIFLSLCLLTLIKPEHSTFYTIAFVLIVALSSILAIAAFKKPLIQST